MILLLTVGLSMIIGVACTGLILLAVEEDNAMDGKWWPSEWGADDQRGAINRITHGVIQYPKMF